MKSKRILLVIIITIPILIILILMGNIINHNIKMNSYVTHLKNKYGLSDGDIQLVSYEKEHKVNVSSHAFHYLPRTVPPIITYEVNGRITKVVDNGKIILDDYQMEDIGYIAAEYFSELLGYNVKFVEFSDTFSSGVSYQTFSDYFQQTNTPFIFYENIENFLIDYGKFDPIDWGAYTTMYLYINLLDDDDINSVLDNFEIKLIPFIKRTNFCKLEIWLYSGNNEDFKIKRGRNMHENLYPDFFINFSVENLENIKGRIFYVDPNGNNRNPNFERIGNFYLDDRGLWFR